MEAQTKTLIKRFLVPLLFANLAVFAGYIQFQPDFLMHINFYDVGQGDSILIQTYLGNQILIDGGPSDAVLGHLGQDLPFFDRTIDMIILTHAHNDHVAGLIDVLKRYRVKKVILPEVAFESGPYKEFLNLIEEKNVERIFAHAGQRIYLDSGTVFDVYYPYGKVAGVTSSGKYQLESDDLNDTSIVGKLSFGKNKILLTGDAGINVEQQLLLQYDLDSDLLKVGHHGSRHSTSKEFLKEVTPEYSVIQVGKNNYGHPTQETLDNLAAASVQVFRNDQNKTVRFVSDGVNLYPVRNPMR
ncbi:MAG: MBL fold metallo-hydrolase [Candidatus Doudnabacteria bacterium]|nr:MBL fold metallo-hydrolase [Candidatus Doudnabacteria bacterium]